MAADEHGGISPDAHKGLCYIPHDQCDDVLPMGGVEGMTEQIAIRPITELADYGRVEALQREVWTFAGDTDIVPTHLLKAVAGNGGVLLGAGLFAIAGLMSDAITGAIIGYFVYFVYSTWMARD